MADIRGSCVIEECREITASAGRVDPFEKSTGRSVTIIVDSSGL